MRSHIEPQRSQIPDRTVMQLILRHTKSPQIPIRHNLIMSPDIECVHHHKISSKASIDRGVVVSQRNISRNAAREVDAHARHHRFYRFQGFLRKVHAIRQHRRFIMLSIVHRPWHIVQQTITSRRPSAAFVADDLVRLVNDTLTAQNQPLAA
jgi:hypothetical protein